MVVMPWHCYNVIWPIAACHCHWPQVATAAMAIAMDTAIAGGLRVWCHKSREGGVFDAGRFGLPLFPAAVPHATAN